jgi:hypothetical protein
MVIGDRSPDRVGEAFRRLSEEAQSRRGVTPPDSGRLVDRVMIALGILVLALVCMGILALFGGQLP